MKFAIALSLTLAAPATGFLVEGRANPNADGSSACYTMGGPVRDRRLADGFLTNPLSSDGAEAEGIACDDPATLTAFTKYEGPDGLCGAQVVVGGETLVGPKKACTNPEFEDFSCSGLKAPDDSCTFDMHWHCTAIAETLVFQKVVFCGTQDDCKFINCAGDPHFKTWAGDDSWYDFHGQCDLKYLSDPEFYQGIGLDIDIRTKARYDYSFVESAAIRLGDDILQVSSYGEVIYNGVEGADVDGAMMAGLFKVSKIDYSGVTNKVGFMITIQDDQYIEVGSFKDMVNIRVMNARRGLWQNTVGMMGDFTTGELKSRDGSKTFDIASQEDIDALGFEWQVRTSDKNLFQTPAADGKCIMPSKNASVARRLGENSVSEEDAKLACANNKHFKMCVYDVMATGDLALATAGVY